jgi:hypothetical protein
MKRSNFIIGDRVVVIKVNPIDKIETDIKVGDIGTVTGNSSLDVCNVIFDRDVLISAKSLNTTCRGAYKMLVNQLCHLGEWEQPDALENTCKDAESKQVTISMSDADYEVKVTRIVRGFQEVKNLEDKLTLVSKEYEDRLAQANRNIDFLINWVVSMESRIGDFDSTNKFDFKAREKELKEQYLVKSLF